MKLTIDVGSSSTRILSDIESILICPAQVDNVHAGTIIPGSVLEKVESDHPPNFPRRPADDPVVKELLRNTITEDQDPTSPELQDRKIVISRTCISEESSRTSIASLLME